MTEQSTPAKILIVEDEALIAREIKHRLINMGWDVVGTAFGEEAVALAVETQPDLLLSDIHLRHGLSGIDLAERIQQVVDVPVVFLTAYSDEDTVARAKQVTPFGYIIKPVENRDLQITIEMALYKFRVEKELREKQQLLQTALACIGNALIFLDEHGGVINLNADAVALLGAAPPEDEGWRDLLGDVRSIAVIIEDALQGKELAKIPPFLMQRAGANTKLVDGIVGPMDEGAVLILRDLGDIEDPVRLGPNERYAMLGAEHLSPGESAFCQLLISPDNLLDNPLAAVVEDVRSILDVSLRSTDLASVFAHSIVSISLPYTDAVEGRQIAEALLAQLADYQHDSEPVTFSAGLAFSMGGDQEPIDLFRRASSALDTARRGGGHQLWVEGLVGDIETREIRGGKDHRHVVLLWNVMNALSSAADLDSMCDEFCRHLFHVFRASRSALLGVEDGRINLAVGYVGDAGRTRHVSDLQLNEREFSMVKGVSLGTVNGQLLADTLLLKVADRWVLLLSGVDFDDEDAAFLETLNTYFASSIARFDVVREPIAMAELPERALVYESPEMQEVLATANLAAPTDATVLVSGESGTGKELVSRYIHEHGDRWNKPLVIVDCGAVAPSLIESELFGHVKGAFTGATASFKGRLKEAEGGTVLLDEVGELPLATQVKLLRFVQERQVAAVGSNQYETVDARVIAATNKDLKAMVDAGEFREDLYYRLNVFSISVPPLRDRRSDILKVAGHYLELFARRYNKRVTGFTTDARQALLSYDWPGNVRELSNVINRSVIVSKDEQVTAIQLGVFSPVERRQASVEVTDKLQTLLEAVVGLGASGKQMLPVGRYLEEDFVLMSLNQHGGVLSRAALSIGVPESTLRRKIQKIEEIYGTVDPDRPSEWPVTRDLYAEIMEEAAEKNEAPLALLFARVFSEIRSRNLNKTSTAQLLGVSPPTLRRIIDESPGIYL